MSPKDAPAAPTPVRSASTARRERRDRCSYLAGERAGMLAGLKEAAALCEERPGGLAISTTIRARISEIEGSPPSPPTPPET